MSDINSVSEARAELRAIMDPEGDGPSAADAQRLRDRFSAALERQGRTADEGLNVFDLDGLYEDSSPLGTFAQEAELFAPRPYGDGNGSFTGAELEASIGLALSSGGR